MYTVMTQVAADALGLPVSRVRFELGDSRFPPAPSPAAPARSRASGRRCWRRRRRSAPRSCGWRWPTGGREWEGIDAAQLGFQGGVVSGPRGRVGLGQLLARKGVEYPGGYGKVDLPAAAKDHSGYAFGAQFAEVRVDPDLGTIRVSRYSGAFDCGRVLNAKTARSQLIGGIVFGIGMALLEETRVDAETGRVVNANVSEYLLPVNADAPDIQTIIVDWPTRSRRGSASKASASCRWSAPPRRSPTPSGTRPASACATCRCG